MELYDSTSDELSDSLSDIDSTHVAVSDSLLDSLSDVTSEEQAHTSYASNKESGKLPDTGGSDTQVDSEIGAALLGLSGLAAYLKKRKTRKNKKA